MKNYDERMENIRAKAKRLKSRRRIAASCTALFLLTLALTLFVPYNTQLPNVERYQNSPYYKLITGINKATFQPPAYKNNYEWLVDVLSNTKFAPTDDAPNSGIASGEVVDVYSSLYSEAIDDSDASQKYEEVTDNQVQGVVEGDLFKRSDKYIYYLRGTELTVYTIDKENSAEVARLNVFPNYDDIPNLWHRQNTHLYLSEDCTTLTVVGDGYSGDFGSFTVLVSLDVSDPANIVRHDPIYFTGSLISSRMVDGQLLLIYNHQITGDIDFDKPETFVPIYGTLENMQAIAPEDIYCPVEEPTSARYTVIAKLDGKTLRVQDTAALLSYSQQVYVSQTAVYATYGCTRSEEAGENIIQTAHTEITGISYTGDNLDVLGTVTVDGSVKDQYSMDEYNGVLRVATSTSVLTRQQRGNDENVWVSTTGREYNCNLYCIDLSTWEVAASVIAFAPDGEEVTSARFDGPMGYICTAEVITMTDPVYFFDLSDIHNITYKHTPIIDGYSTSLINFGDYLLGIGKSGSGWWSGGLKVEAYEETADGVLPICAYEREASAAEDYKAYFVDRENQLIGLHVVDYDGTQNRPYLLLHFDGYQFHEVKVIISPKTDCGIYGTRAFLADSYLYILTEEPDGFIVTKLP